MTARPGTVYLVGAGPGDPGLITSRGLDLVRTCDVVLYDRLVSPQLLAEARPDAERVFVGKKPGEAHSRQVVSDALLVARARENKSVVRLKGGDPFVFGRGAEEALLLRDSSIPFEIVPGVSSAVAVPAYAGIPVTHRGLSSSFVVLTAREEGAYEPDAAALTVGAETIVLLMGVSALEATTRRLIDAGRDPSEPAAAIEWGTTGLQRVVVAELQSIAKRASEAGLAPPATTVIGKVVSLRDKLAWFEGRPLLGRTVAVTRPPHQSRELAERLSDLGAEVVELPLIEITDPSSWLELDRAIRELETYDWVLFSSANVVERFLNRMAVRGRDDRALSTTEIGAVGDRTVSALAAHGLIADLVPTTFTGAAWAEALGPGTGKILLPRVEGAPDELRSALTERGWEVDEVAVYANVPGSPTPESIERVRAGEVDIITFTSASTVRHFSTVVGSPAELTRVPTVVCIGPSTAAAAEEAGLVVAAEAEPHNTDGLVAAVAATAADGGTM